MLLNAHNLDSITFSAKESIRPVLSGLYVTPTHTVATDSYRLIEIETPSQDAKEMPTGMESTLITSKETWFILPSGAVKKAMNNIQKKPILSILKNVVLDTDEDANAILKTTDVSTIDSVKTKFIDGRFPEYRQVIPKTKPLSAVRISADYLESMAGFFKKHGGEANSGIVLELHGSTSPVILKGKTEEGQKMLGLIMPMRPENGGENIDDTVSPEHKNAFTTFALLKKTLEYIPTSEKILIRQVQECINDIESPTQSNA